MNKKRIQELRATLDAEQIDLVELGEIEAEFAKIPASKLRDRRENATASDMLDELETWDGEGGELVIPLASGGSLRCGPGDDYMFGGYLRICDADGHEVVYWSQEEWQRDPEQVIGAVFRCACTPIRELLASLNRNRVIDGFWQ